MPVSATPILYESHCHTPLCKHAVGDPEEYCHHALRRHQKEPLAEILRRFDRYLRQFCTLAPRHDDRALLVVRAR